MLGTPTRDRRAERREATIAEILDVAWELAKENGLAGLSLRDVAKQVGVQPPSLYSYFANKHAIYDAMFAQGCREYLAAEAKVPLVGDLRADLGEHLRFFVTFCTDQPVRYQLLFQRTIPGFEPSPESFALSLQSYESMTAKLAALGVTDPRHIDLLTALATGLTDQQISNDPGGDRWVQLLDDAIDMFVEHVSRTPTKKRGRRS